MPIDPQAVGRTSEPRLHHWTSTDCLLYALGVGAGQSDPTGTELEFTTENTAGVVQRVLPTFAVTIGLAMPLDQLGTFDMAMLVHGEQSIVLHDEIPVEGSVRTTGTVSAVYDKGSGAVVEIEATSVDVETERPLITAGMSLFIRGEGGFGGERGPSGAGPAVPERAPDHTVSYPTRTDQALLYRLCGDRNPLHSDPGFAQRAGFDRPILHGLCTYGIAGRALLHTLCGSDPARFSSMRGRFSKPVLPGQSLTTKMWRTTRGKAVFVTENEAGQVVLDRGVATFG